MIKVTSKSDQINPLYIVTLDDNLYVSCNTCVGEDHYINYATGDIKSYADILCSLGIKFSTDDPIYIPSPLRERYR